MATTITADELLAYGEKDLTIIDVGNHVGRKEIRNAIRYRPTDLLAPDHLTLPLPVDRKIVLYGAEGSSERIEAIAERFERSGFADVAILSGGFTAYEKAGGATQEASVEQVVPPSRPQEASELDRRI